MTDVRTGETRDRSSSLEFAVLREQAQITAAARDLRERGLVGRRPDERLDRRILRRLRGQPDPALVLKTWDVQRALDAFSSRVDRRDAVLDMGCWACDMLPALHRLGYTNLYGIDLNPAIAQMPYAGEIEYAVGDLLATPWPDGHFAGISSISVIEHGVADEQLCREVSRLLRPGGVFVFSTDYWPEKVQTNERIFDLDWRIFDTAEIETLVGVAREHNLHPLADPAESIRLVERPAIHYAGKDYTFLYGAFIRGDD